MLLREHLETSGAWLFRWRSYLPLLCILVMLPAIIEVPRHQVFWLEDELYDVACLLLIAVGLGIRIMTLGRVPRGTSGRNVENQKANTLNTTGMYSVVRNPLYLGNFFVGIGVSAVAQSWWCSLIVALLFCIYYERIIAAEEAFLRNRFGDDYINWAKRTPAFFPNFRSWIRPSLPFSLRTVLKREHATFLGATLSFGAMDIARDSVLAGRFTLNALPLWVMAVGVAAYVVIWTVRKLTHFFDVEGR